MVDQTELNHAAALWGESQTLERALANFDAGGRIVAMTIDPEPVTIETRDMSYPPQMVQAIKIVLQNRHDAIVRQLSALGVTGIDAATARRPPQQVGRNAPQTAAQPARETPKPEPPKHEPPKHQPPRTTRR